MTLRNLSQSLKRVLFAEEGGGVGVLRSNFQTSSCFVWGMGGVMVLQGNFERFCEATSRQPQGFFLGGGGKGRFTETDENIFPIKFCLVHHTQYPLRRHLNPISVNVEINLLVLQRWLWWSHSHNIYNVAFKRARYCSVYQIQNEICS